MDGSSPSPTPASYAPPVVPTLAQLKRLLEQAEARRLPRDRYPRRAAVAVALAEDEGRLWVAMIRRSDNPRDPWSGHMSFPGGREDPGDQDAWATAIREAREEVELQLARAWRLGRLPEIQAFSHGKAMPMAIAPVVFGLQGRPPLDSASDEVAEALWIPLEELRNPQRVVFVPRTYGGRSFDLPGIDYEGRIVWGLTHRMLSSLLALLPPAR